MSKQGETPKIFSLTPVRLATSTKDDGHTSFSKVSDQETESNINNFVDGLNWPDKSRAFMRIVYREGKTYNSITVLRDSNKPPRLFTKKYALDVDALITNLPQVVLLLPIADCYPVTLFDPNNKVLALAHVGWHSTAAHLIQKVVSQMSERFGSKPADLLVHIGPGIPAQYYKFKDPIQLNLPGWTEHLHKTSDGYEIDLLSYNLEQLSLAGVSGQNIEIDSRNTVESDEFESHHVNATQGLPPARRFLTATMLSP